MKPKGERMGWVESNGSWNILGQHCFRESELTGEAELTASKLLLDKWIFKTSEIFGLNSKLFTAKRLKKITFEVLSSWFGLTRKINSQLESYLMAIYPPPQCSLSIAEQRASTEYGLSSSGFLMI